MKTIGITTTIPTEVLLAAGYQPVDLNNIFISDPDPQRYVNIAERDGFPANCCTWIKGIYGVALDKNIDTVMCVTNGDCSNTLMLMEVFKLKGIATIPFAYPDKPDTSTMQHALELLAAGLGTTIDAAEKMRQKLEQARRLAHELDGLTWKDGVVNGRENHYWLVSASDFLGDVDKYERQLDRLLNDCRKRKPYADDMLRLAYIGVPPIFVRDFHDFTERNGARVVFNEMQRQFAMLNLAPDLVEQYRRYTYPYRVWGRLDDIRREVKARRIDGVIHYVQSFCYRQMEDVILREALDVPVLTLEGDLPGPLDARTELRLESFVEMLR